MLKEINFNLENDIGYFPNAITEEMCETVIERYQTFEQLNLTFPRSQQESSSSLKQDNTAFILDQPSEFILDSNHLFLENFLSTLWTCFRNYTKHYPSLDVEVYKQPLYIRQLRLQKTLPGEGYHVWHYEADTIDTCKRLCAWSVFLNNVEEGGETEFLHQHKRYSASRGDILIWPSTYTHTHRGNTPLSNEKYLLTGWIEY